LRLSSGSTDESSFRSDENRAVLSIHALAHILIGERASTPPG